MKKLIPLQTLFFYTKEPLYSLCPFWSIDRHLDTFSLYKNKNSHIFVITSLSFLKCGHGSLFNSFVERNSASSLFLGSWISSLSRSVILDFSVDNKRCFVETRGLSYKTNNIHRKLKRKPSRMTYDFSYMDQGLLLRGKNLVLGGREEENWRAWRFWNDT